MSPVTGEECERLLGRKPDRVTPNGLNIDRFDVGHEFQTQHSEYKEEIHRVVMGHWFLVRDNLGLELGISNYPGAAPTRRGNAVSFSEYHPNVSEEAAARVREIGGVAYGAEMQRRAVGWIADEPVEFLKLTAARASLFWVPRSGGLRTMAEVGTAFLMMVGLATAFRRRRHLLLDLHQRLVVTILIVLRHNALAAVFEIELLERHILPAQVHAQAGQAIGRRDVLVHREKEDVAAAELAIIDVTGLLGSATLQVHFRYIKNDFL